MKTKIFIVFAMMVASFFAKAQPTYLHDKATCNFDGKEIQLELRSPEQYSPSADDTYGTILLVNGTPIEKISSRFRFFGVFNEICSKVLALPVKKNEIAFVLLKDNRPFTDIVTILYYNPDSRDVELMETQISARDARLKDGKIFFKVAKQGSESNFGSVVINKRKYIYEEKPFESWMSFDGKDFKFDRKMSLDNFEYSDLVGPADMKKLEDGSRKYKVAISGDQTCFAMDSDDWNCK